MTQEQLDAYSKHVRIEEICQKLRIGDIFSRHRLRCVSPHANSLALGADAVYSSPSPQPEYNNYGQRTNTREARARQKLETERHKLIHEMTKIIPSYHTPTDYRPPPRTGEKIYVPVRDYPEVNFSIPPLEILWNNG